MSSLTWGRAGSPAKQRPALDRRWALASAFAGALCGACAGTPSTSFELDVPTAIAAKAAWYEIGVFPSECPASTLLLGGIPQQGTVARLAFAKGASAPALGLLKTGTYGIAAVARAADCSVVATGCASVDASGSTTLAVSLAPIDGTAVGSCAAGTTCNEAECVPAADAASSIGGASCSLALLGQGPLADPLVDDSTLSAPAISATPTGFLIAYREVDPDSGDTRLTTISIDANGAAAAPAQTSLSGGCTGGAQTDATGLAFAGATGTVALSRPSCPTAGEADGGTAGSVAGVDILTIDAKGAIHGSAFNTIGTATVLLGQAHSVASTPAGIVLAYTNPITETSFAATLNGSAIAGNPTPFTKLGPLQNLATAYVTGTDEGVAYVSLGTGTPDAGSGGASLVSVATRGTGDAGVTRAPLFGAAWASASGVGSQILVASNGPSNDESIQWSAFDIGSGSAGPTGTFSPASMGNVSFVDVAVHQDHAFFVAEVDQSISLFAFDKASTFPVFLSEVPFASLPTLPIGALRDGLVAVAANDTQVAVVWGTGNTLGSNDNVGGFAIFACSTP